MLIFKKNHIISLLIGSALGASASFASQKVSLDLQGNGQMSQVGIPFQYYNRQNGDHLTLIHQGSYKVYDIEQNQNEVAVIGTLRPCIGVAVTDGKKLITFHKHFTSSLASMKQILEEHLDLSQKENLYARIYTTRDDELWKIYQPHHQGKSHNEEVKTIKDYLSNEVGLPREHIPASLHRMRNNSGELNYPNLALGRYDLAELCVAVRLNDLFEGGEKKQIKFSSIDPFQEDVFGYKGTQVSMAEYFGENLAHVQKLQPGTDFHTQFLAFDDIPRLYFESTGDKEGYRIQRNICQGRLGQEENQLYRDHFGKKSLELAAEKNYNTLPFFPTL